MVRRKMGGLRGKDKENGTEKKDREERKRNIVIRGNITIEIKQEE